MGEEYITVGEIVGTHGHRGAVRLIPHTDFPERFGELEEIAVWLGGRRTFFGVEGAFVHRRLVVLKLRGVDSLEAARRLRGGLLQITRDRLRPLPPGHYYLFEIVGLEVYGVEGEPLGRVADVIRTGANDVYVVRGGKGEILIPALKTVVREIDLDRGRMTVDLPPGLVE